MAASVSSVKTLEEAKATPGVLYMRMPVCALACQTSQELNLTLRAQQDREHRNHGLQQAGLPGPFASACGLTQRIRHRFQEILDIGSKAAKKMLGEWAKERLLPTGMERGFETGETKRRGVSVRRNSI